MPSVHIFNKRSTELDDQGVSQMKSLVTLRYAPWQNFIAEDLLEELIRDCGGDLRDFLRAIKVVLLGKEADPNTSRADLLDVVRSQISPPKLVPNTHLAWMARLEASHEAELDDVVDGALFQRYLSTKHVLAYLNGDAWYAVHPLLRQWVFARAQAAVPAAPAA